MAFDQVRDHLPADTPTVTPAERSEALRRRMLAVERRRARSQELSRVVPDACGLVWSVARARKVAGAGILLTGTVTAAWVLGVYVRTRRACNAARHLHGFLASLRRAAPLLAAR